jgi:hypothetical protein
MDEVIEFATMLVNLGFASDVGCYLTRYAGIGSLEEIAYLDVDDVEVISIVWLLRSLLFMIIEVVIYITTIIILLTSLCLINSTYNIP